MKKNYFMLAAATMLFAACAETDVLVDVSEKENAPQEIGFDAFANKATRAEITNNNLTSTTLKVWGWKTVDDTPTDIFSGIPVEHNGTKWTYANPNDIKYWDKEASYNFYAASPYANNVSINSDVEDAIIKITNVVSGPATTAVDYLITRETIEEDGSTGDEVDFTLNHIMSKISVNVLKSEELDKDITLTDLTMSGWNRNPGTFVQGAVPEWSIATSGTAGTHTFVSSAEEILSTSAAYEAGSYLMVPQTVGTLTFTISYMVGDETFTAHSGELTNQVWETNTHYTYNIIVGPAAIEFGDVVVDEEWEIGELEDDGEINIQ